MYEHDEREVREFLIYILDKLPGVMLDLISYHREPLVAAISDDSTKGGTYTEFAFLPYN